MPMPQRRKAVFFFCAGEIDPVAGRVFQASRDNFSLESTDILVDDRPVLKYTDTEGNVFFYVRTEKVVSHDFTRYLPIMKRYFQDCDLAGIVTWHEGENAPDGILPVHTTGDVDSGNFGPADPELMRNLLLAMERDRLEEGLQDFRVVTEATHWSGMVYGGGGPERVQQYPVPLLDIEIGSSPGSWANEGAARVLAMSLPSVFKGDGRRLRNLLCAGGVHFEPAFANAVFQQWDHSAFGVSHILANQWLVTGKYEDPDGPARLEACVGTIRGGIEGIAFHDNLKGVYKDRFRRLASDLGIPVFKHQALRRPEEIQWTR
jgi:D-tyrosyl-tRNA(Tyr) deacylase